MDDATLEQKVLAKYPQYGDMPRTQAAQPQPITNRMGPDNRGTLEKINDWWTRKTAPFEGTLDNPGRSPQQKVKDFGKGAAVASLPFLGASAVAAPVATAVGTGGAVLGGYAGSKAGKYLGGKVGAPELGEDVGGLAGTLAGGGGAGKIADEYGTEIGNKAASVLRYPATARQSQLGRPGTVKNILPAGLQRYTIPDWMIPKGEEGTPTNPGPFMDIPMRVKVPKAAKPTQGLSFEGQSSTAPGALPQGEPTPFTGGTEPTTSTGPVQPSFVKSFTQPKGKIVEPGSEPPDVKVTYQSVPQPDLLKMVKGGDSAAIKEWQRRGLQLPPNVGYMVESGAGTLPWRNYRR